MNTMTGFLKYLKHMAVGLLTAMPVVVAYGFLVPWPVGEQALSRYPGQTPIMVAEFYHSKSWRDRGSDVWVTRKSETRSYVLIPSVFSNPRIVTVSQDNDDEPVVSESRTPFILIALADMIAFAVLGVRYLSTRPPKPYRLSPEEARTFYGSRLPQK
jgi:hypothetical protein